MTKQFEIFATKAPMDTKTGAIDTLFGYPNEEYKTDTYRTGVEEYEGTRWAGAVGDSLVTACAEMTPSERAVYYDDSDLKSHQWLLDNNWFPPVEE